MARVWTGPLLALALLTVSACGSSDSTASPAPSPSATAAPSTTIPPTTAPPESVVVAATDEVTLDPSTGQLIHRDGDGAYICVIRRLDDLAALRAPASRSSDAEEESP